METESLNGKAALVSGGTTGIGRTTAKMLAEAGCKVLLYGRHEKELKEALEEIGEGVQGFVADQAEKEGIETIFREVDEKLGTLDILVNNAAIGAGSVIDSDYEDADYVVRSNLLGYLQCTREAVKRIKQKDYGDIVHIGSMSAHGREKGTDIYTATKSGIDGFADSLRRELMEDNIRVTLIEPGLVGTEMPTDSLSKDEFPELQAKHEMLKTEDIAACVIFALSQPRRSSVIRIQCQPSKAKE
ncbi:MAG: SDR family oxidoreductase [Fimbriimonadaceae bacterium]|nr:SDR family oxidoreductase [Fimbriimonadaceae bacterium]QYK56995.1 MAG: SDR family oxidoreductase [Fimbriimonadaceae bacterium]